MITINNIIDGICKALNDEFGDEYEIYTEDVKQGLTEPCFSVLLVRPTSNQFLGKRYYRTNLFCIHYFPASENDEKAECFDVQERLFHCLEYITVDGDLTRGTNMEGAITDNVLSFMVNYDLFVVKESTGEPVMEELEQGVNVKG